MSTNRDDWDGSPGDQDPDYELAEGQAEAPAPAGRRQVRTAIAVLAALNLGLIGMLIAGSLGMVPTPAPPAVAAAPAPVTTVVPDSVPGVSAIPSPAATQAGSVQVEYAAPGPRQTGPQARGGRGGGGGGGGGGGSSEWYAPSGGLQDIFCRPRQGETQEEWLARVSSSCQ